MITILTLMSDFSPFFFYQKWEHKTMALQQIIMTKERLCVVANAYLPYRGACYVVAIVIAGTNSDSIICYKETILILQLKYRITCIFSSFKSFDTIIDRLI